MSGSEPNGVRVFGKFRGSYTLFLLGKLVAYKHHRCHNDRKALNGGKSEINGVLSFVK